jgi:hypothetical protein
MVDESEAAEALPAVSGRFLGSGCSRGLYGDGRAFTWHLSLGVRLEVRFAFRAPICRLVPASDVNWLVGSPSKCTLLARTSYWPPQAGAAHRHGDLAAG